MRIKTLGLREYAEVWTMMRQFVQAADAETEEELWLLEHPPVYTLGQAGRREHLLRDSAIPLVQSDRGGQITYHAPGQVVLYLLLNIKRRKLGIRPLVRLLEDSVIAFLGGHGIVGDGDGDAPGVYVRGRKIAALGLRIRHGWSYHGISVNVKMDLTPFANINPCGYPGLQITQMVDEGADIPTAVAADGLAAILADKLK